MVSNLRKSFRKEAQSFSETMVNTRFDQYNPAATPPASHYLSTDPDDISLAGNESSTCVNSGAGSGSGSGTGKQRGQNDRSDQTQPSPLPPCQQSKTKYDVGWRRITRNTTPSWFAVVMGTGVCGILLHAIPWQAQWLQILSIMFFVLNTALFAIFTLLSIARYTIWPEIWTVMTRDPVHSLFLGCFPMGFATLIQLWVGICVPAWGPWATTFAWAMWMLDAVLSAAIAISLPFLLMSRHPINSLDRITAAQLLPVVSTIVAAGAGARVASVLPNDQYALGTVICSYVLWGMGVPLAMVVLVMYYQRLCVHKLPPREVVVSCFLPLGPLGMGGFTIMELGKVALTLFPRTNTLAPATMAGEIVYCLGFLVALIMWGFGLIWLGLALFTIHNARPFPFNMGWWGFTFPIGVYTASTLQLGQEIPSKFFDVLGTIFSVAVILLWMVVAVHTAIGACKGHLFNAPCLAALPDKYKYPKSQRTDAGKVA